MQGEFIYHKTTRNRFTHFWPIWNSRVSCNPIELEYANVFFQSIFILTIRLLHPTTNWGISEKDFTEQTKKLARTKLSFWQKKSFVSAGKVTTSPCCVEASIFSFHVWFLGCMWYYSVVRCFLLQTKLIKEWRFAKLHIGHGTSNLIELSFFSSVIRCCQHESGWKTTLELKSHNHMR